MTDLEQATETMGQWQFWIDRGGTFTDLVARRPDGTLLSHKLLSENPELYRDAAIQGIRDLLGLGRDGAVPSRRVEAVKQGGGATPDREGTRRNLQTFLKSASLRSASCS